MAVTPTAACCLQGWGTGLSPVPRKACPEERSVNCLPRVFFFPPFLGLAYLLLGLNLHHVLSVMLAVMGAGTCTVHCNWKLMVSCAVWSFYIIRYKVFFRTRSAGRSSALSMLGVIVAFIMFSLSEKTCLQTHWVLHLVMR